VPNSKSETGDPPAVRGETLLCLGNTEHRAGSDVANVRMQAENVEGGWVLNGAISDLALVTAISDPEAARNRRLEQRPGEGFPDGGFHGQAFDGENRPRGWTLGS